MMQCQSTIYRNDDKESAILALGRKTFFLRPVCLDRYLHGLPLSATTREVFWLHWGMGYRQHSITTTLSINQVADYLKISPSTVSRAYDQLIGHGLLIRRGLAAAHGGCGVTETTITVPDAVLTVLLADNRDRAGCPTSDVPYQGDLITIDQDAIHAAVFRTPEAQETESPATSDTPAVTVAPTIVAPSAVTVAPTIVAPSAGQEPSRTDLTQRIEALDAQIAHWNAIAVQCAKTKDFDAYQEAVNKAEQAQRRRERLRTELAKLGEASDLIPESDDRTPAAMTETESSTHASAHQTAPTAITPATTQPTAITPTTTQPAITTPAATQPVVTTPAVTQPAATQPVVTTPAVTQPAATQPIVTTPAVTQPAATQPTTMPRQLGTTIRNKIFQRVADIRQVSYPKGVAQEIIYSIEQGAQANRPVPWAINSALALVRNNRWRTPYGFGKPTEGTPRTGEGYPQFAGRGTPNLGEPIRSKYG